MWRFRFRGDRVLETPTTGSSLSPALAARFALPDDILETIGEGFYALDDELRFVYLNRVTETEWGMLRADLIGRRATEVFPQWIGSESHVAHLRALSERKPQLLETVSSVTGRAVELRVFPRADGLSGFFRDISARKEIERKLRERDELLRLAEASAGIGIWDMEMGTQLVRATPQFFRILGLEPTQEPVPIAQLRALRHPDDREKVVTDFAAAIARGDDQYESEYRIIRPDGEVRWVFGRGRVVRDAGGKVVRYSGVDLDITQRKKYEELLALTTRELSHRTKNVLAVVQSIVHHVAKNAQNFDELMPRLEGCIQALAYCHDLLIASNWQSVDFRNLIELQVAPFGGIDSARFEAEGPSLALGPQTAQLIGLALHELATNAAKYGALRSEHGKVTIEWAMLADGVQISWREDGGPPVEPPTRKGFGHTVLERMARSLDGTVSLEFPPEGVRWSLKVAAQHLVPR